MVQHKNSPNSTDGNLSKNLSKMSFQKRDNPDSRSMGGNIGKGTNKANGQYNIQGDVRSAKLT